VSEHACDSASESESGSGSGGKGRSDILRWKVQPGAATISFDIRYLVISDGIGVVVSTG
jgi:hypothetical protein